MSGSWFLLLVCGARAQVVKGLVPAHRWVRMCPRPSASPLMDGIVSQGLRLRALELVLVLWWGVPDPGSSGRKG